MKVYVLWFDQGEGQKIVGVVRGFAQAKKVLREAFDVEVLLMGLLDVKTDKLIIQVSFADETLLVIGEPYNV